MKNLLICCVKFKQKKNIFPDYCYGKQTTKKTKQITRKINVFINNNQESCFTFSSSSFQAVCFRRLAGFIEVCTVLTFMLMSCFKKLSRWMDRLLYCCEFSEYFVQCTLFT